jgi:predicted ribosome quality control (RQC) complex YloA/Tae2 family protein
LRREKGKFHDEFAEASHQILTMLGARKKDVVFDDKNLSLKVHFETRLHYDIFLKVAKEGTLRELAEKKLEATKIKDEKQENKNKKQRNKNKKQKKTHEKQRKEAFLKNYTEANAVVTGYLNAYAAWRRESYVARQEPDGTERADCSGCDFCRHSG